MSYLKDVVNTPLSRKRTRSDSSPIFGDFSPIGIDDLEALCEIEAQLNQASSPLSKKRKRSPAPLPKVDPRPLELLKENKPVSVSSATKVVSEGLKPASSKTYAQSKPSTNYTKPKEPEFDEYDDEFDSIPPPEEGYDSWFQPAVNPPPAFVSFVRPSVGPSTGAMKIIQPSAAALKAAEKLLASVETEENEEGTSATTAPAPTRADMKPPQFVPPKSSTVSAPKKEVEKKVVTEELPPAARPDSSIAPVTSSDFRPVTAVKVVPNRSNIEISTPGGSKEIKTVAHETPARKPASSFAISESPAIVPKHLGMRSRPRGSIKAKFATPWKQGVQPPTQPPAMLQLNNPRIVPSPQKPSTSKVIKTANPKRILRDANTVFDLNPPPNRQKLCDLSIKKRRSLEPLQELGIPVAVGDVEPWNALYWVFEENEVRQDVNTAFDALKNAGCSLLNKAWLENHWTQIVWKLANMTVLWPSAQAERWCYKEVLNQLLYRYEREINRCERPAIRLIQERDASPSSAMVLCVFEISCPSGTRTENVAPELVLTDGWYKIRAQTDVALVRAIKKRKIRVGSKLEIIGAKLDAQRKDAEEVLKSFNSSSLILSGNSTHLAPWHTKLGFRLQPSAATLNSLVPDGGIVPMMFVTIVNAFPLAFIESRERGERDSRDEAEEQAARDQWERKREAEGNKLREELCKKLETMRGHVERLQNIAGSAMSRTSEDSAPDDVESMIEDLEESEDPKSMMKALSPTTAAWMAHALNAKIIKEHEDMAGEITSELEASFPARTVRSCRVLLVKDAVNVKKGSLRVAQVTVWDAEALGKEALVEGKTYMVSVHDWVPEGTFDAWVIMEAHPRLQVTNLFPQIPNAWGKPGAEGQVFLVTRRDTRWKKVATEKR